MKISKRNINSVLMLGMGGGSVVSILKKELRMGCKITAVDFDPVIIDLAHKYFDIDKYGNLEIVCADAFDFMKNNRREFDLIVFDVYIDIDIPSRFESREFLNYLHKAVKKNGMIVFNKDYNSEMMHSRLSRFESDFESAFPGYKRYQVIPMNYFFVSYNN